MIDDGFLFADFRYSVGHEIVYFSAYFVFVVVVIGAHVPYVVTVVVVVAAFCRFCFVADVTVCVTVVVVVVVVVVVAAAAAAADGEKLRYFSFEFLVHPKILCLQQAFFARLRYCPTQLSERQYYY